MTPEERAELICRRHALWNPSGSPSVYYTDLVEAIAQARAEALEEAAKICQMRAVGTNNTHANIALNFAAEAIRSLKGTE